MRVGGGGGGGGEGGGGGTGYSGLRRHALFFKTKNSHTHTPFFFFRLDFSFSGCVSLVPKHLRFCSVDGFK